jgi:hypothetical protein
MVAILLVLWLMGWSMQYAGAHLFLLLALLVMVLWKLATARRTT